MMLKTVLYQSGEGENASPRLHPKLCSPLRTFHCHITKNFNRLYEGAI